MIIGIVSGIIAAFAGFVIAPAFALLMHLTRHWNIQDFDLMSRQRLENSQYAPYLNRILSDIAYMRGLSYENVTVRSFDGAALSAKLTGNGDRLMILAHGFHTTPLNNFATLARTYLNQGYSVLLIDERGHGASAGHTTMGLKEERDMLCWADWAQQDGRFTAFAMHGISMGGAALIMASDRINRPKLKALVCDCAYYSLNMQMDTVKQMRSLPARIVAPFMKLFMRLIYGEDSRKDGLEALKNSTVPILFLAGGQDSVVTAGTIKAACEACAGNGRYILVPGAKHTLTGIAGGDDVRGQLIDFLEKQFEKRSTTA